MFSQFLSDLSPAWLIIVGFILISFVLKTQILKIIRTLAPQKLFSVGFSFALILSIGLGGSGASALEALANNPEIQKAELSIISDKIEQQIHSQS
jgi:hypothetical protein